MKRSAILNLKQEVRREVPGSNGLFVIVVPSEAENVFDGAANAQDPMVKTRRVCQRVFIGFEGYTEDDGKPVENTVEARMELYGVPPIRSFIDNLVLETNLEAVAGEDDAVSD